MRPSHRDFLKAAQNADGGWGYFPGKQSWLEPSAYAMLALQDDPGGAAAFARGWEWLLSWQLPDGGWRPCAQVSEAHWTTALCVLLHCARGVYNNAFRQGVGWLLRTSGAESGWRMRAMHWLQAKVVEFDPRLTGWPWFPGASSWVEPTALTLAALRKASGHYPAGELARRVEMGQRMILERRCRDGGWNHGNRRVFGADLASYPESTGLGLLGLAGIPSAEVAASLGRARRYWLETRSRFARAWLRLALEAWGAAPGEPQPVRPTGDILLAALEDLSGARVLG